MSPKRPSHFELIFSHSVVTQEVLDCKYSGKGTEEEPYSVVFIPHDPRNPMLFSKFRKWFITAILGIATLAVSFNSSAYSGGVQQVIEEFQCTDTVATLGIALFVLGFAIGPLLWGPLSELYGRQILFFVTYGVMTAFNGGAGGAQNVETLLILRFFAGVFGSSVLTNGGGVIADCFPAKERGLAMVSHVFYYHHLSLQLMATTAAVCRQSFYGACIRPSRGRLRGRDYWLEMARRHSRYLRRHSLDSSLHLRSRDICASVVACQGGGSVEKDRQSLPLQTRDWRG